MKPFNLKEALAGKSVMTRNGVKVVRLFHAEEANEANKVIVVLETGLVGGYAEDGTYYTHSVSWLDLVMVPQKKEGWINLYQGVLSRFSGRTIYSSKEAAISAAMKYEWEPHEFVTIKIEWEE